MHAVADSYVMLYHRMRANANVVANFVQFAEEHSVTGLESRANAVTGIYYRMGAYDSIRSNVCSQVSAGHPARRYAKYYVFPDLAANAQMNIRLDYK